MEGVWRDEDTTVWCRCQRGKCGVSSLAPQPIALYTPRLLARFCCLGGKRCLRHRKWLWQPFGCYLGPWGRPPSVKPVEGRSRNRAAALTGCASEQMFELPSLFGGVTPEQCSYGVREWVRPWGFVFAASSVVARCSGLNSMHGFYFFKGNLAICGISVVSSILIITHLQRESSIVSCFIL